MSNKVPTATRAIIKMTKNWINKEGKDSDNTANGFVVIIEFAP
tara:strand:- start:627 stop:755 length:129 start_codon:yes stop_codon:yes gene_type:complete